MKKLVQRRGTDGVWQCRSEVIADPGNLVELVSGRGCCAWLRAGQGLVGFGEAARLRIDPGPDRFDRAQRAWESLLAETVVHDDVRVPGSGPVALGSFPFDPDVPGGVLVIPAVVVGQRDGVCWRTTFHRPVRAAADRWAEPPAEQHGPVRWTDTGISREQWSQRVGAALAAIDAGRVEKVVLARQIRGQSERGIDLPALLRVSTRRFPECFTFLCGDLFGSTPELLVSRHGDRIASVVLAGSTGRGQDGEQDAALSHELRTSAKDSREHRFAVDSVAGTLASVCTGLTVPASPELLRLANIQHLATRIDGTLEQPDMSALRLAGALHPTAAVCGAPTDEALRLIRSLEPEGRDRYAGPVGWVDAAGNGEWGIALRCAEITGAGVRTWAGAGIVAGSVPEAEFRETDLKFRAVVEMMAEAGQPGRSAAPPSTVRSAQVM
ncbi:MAG: menaquinone-specific isochorismate synthase [Mycobacteriales bacterium]